MRIISIHQTAAISTCLLIAGFAIGTTLMTGCGTDVPADQLEVAAADHVASYQIVDGM